MRRISLLITILALMAIYAWAGDTGLGTDPYSSGDELPASTINTFNNQINDNAADILLMENFLPATMAEQSDCSTISAGWCRDTDDNVLYYWDGDSVESMGGGAIDTHESTYDHDAYDTHTSNTSNPHSVDAEDILEGASPSVTLAGGDIDGSATAWTLPPDGPDTLLFSALSDSTSPHNLIENETIEAILSNYGASADAVLDFEDIAIQSGRDFCVVIEAAYQVTIEPDTGENWYLNGTQCGADDAIFNDDDTIGEMVCCISTGNNMFCVSQDANWECE
jgi:hypothetical protein